MTDDAVIVRPVDLGVSTDIDGFVAMLDAYASDPMGAGSPLSAEVIGRLRVDLVEHPTLYAVLAEADRKPVGFATCFLGYSTFRARPLLNIHDIAVLPTWRGRGIARRMLDAIISHARGLGCCRLTLEVRSDNLRARHVYQRAGFRPGDCDLFLEKRLDG